MITVKKTSSSDLAMNLNMGDPHGLSEAPHAPIKITPDQLQKAIDKTLEEHSFSITLEYQGESIELEITYPEFNLGEEVMEAMITKSQRANEA